MNKISSTLLEVTKNLFEPHAKKSKCLILQKRRINVRLINACKSNISFAKASRGKRITLRLRF